MYSAGIISQSGTSSNVCRNVQLAAIYFLKALLISAASRPFNTESSPGSRMVEFQLGGATFTKVLILPQHTKMKHQAYDHLLPSAMTRLLKSRRVKEELNSPDLPSQLYLLERRIRPGLRMRKAWMLSNHLAYIPAQTLQEPNMATLILCRLTPEEAEDMLLTRAPELMLREPTSDATKIRNTSLQNAKRGSGRAHDL